VEIDSEGPIESQEFMNAVWNTVTGLYGEYGASQTGLTLINYDGNRNNAIIRCLLSSADMIRASVASMTKIGNKPSAVHVTAVSGTIKGLHRKIPSSKH
jgi:RNase P/RNase MRP subunit POP5